MTDQDDIEDDVDAPKCKACGVPWTRHQGIIAICRQYLETVETLERVTKERDEARRWVCSLLAHPEFVMGLAKPGDGTKYAFEKEQGWDCFKEPNL